MKKRMLSLLLVFSMTLSMFPLGEMTAFAQNPVLYGDADGNGKVELLDANLMERYIAKDEEAISTIHFTEADVNADGVIDDLDVQKLKSYLVGNLDTLEPVLHTISFNTDGGGELAPIKAGDGCIYRGEIPVPAKDQFVFVNWVKEDGTPYYQTEDVIEADITLTAVYEPLENAEQLQITSFSLDNQPKDVSFDITGDFSDVAQVQANIKVLPKDGSDPVEISVKENADGTFTVYAPNGFSSGASYELTLGDGLYFADKDKMFRTVYFIIEKEEVDHLQYHSDLIFIKDTDEMNYTVDGQTTPVLESALLSNEDGEEQITGSFTMSGGNLKTDDVVCIYENTHPNDRDYTKNNYEDDALAYIRITGGGNGVYQFESLNEEDAEEVLAMPDTIPYHVEKLPDSDGTVDRNSYDTYARAMLGENEAPSFAIDDFLVFYTDSFENITNNSNAVYGQITGVNGNTVSYKIISKEDIEKFMSMFVSQEVDKEKLREAIDQEELINRIQEQVENSGFMEEATNRMLKSALETEEIQQKLLSAGMTQAEIQELQNSPTPMAVGATGGRTKFIVDDKNIEVTPIFGQNFKNGVGVGLDIGITMHVEKKMPNNQISTIQFELSAYLEQEISLGFDVNIEDKWKWYFIIPVLEDLDVTVSVDIQNYTYMSVGAKIYTLRDERMKKKWTALSETVTGPNASVTTREIINKMNKLAAKIKKAAAKGEEKLETLQEEYNRLKGMLPSVVVDGVTYSVEEIEKDLQAEDVGEAFEESLNASTGIEAKTGMEELMERYQEMLNQECDWIDLYNQTLFEQEFHIKIIAVKVTANLIVKGNVNLAIGADLEYQVGKRYSFWLHILDLESGSSEIDLIDERFGFQFYVMGTLGLKAGVKVDLACGLLSTSLASVGANVEFGAYLKLYGYFIYYFERLRPAGSTAWNETEEMLGAMYVDFGLYVTVKFKAQALANTFKYEPTLYDGEFPLLTVGDRKSVYDFALSPDDDDILYVWDDDENSLNGIAMTMPEIYYTMKTMDLVNGEMGEAVYPGVKFIVTFSDSRFSLDKQGRIQVDVPEGSRYLRCNMRIVWKCNKLAFSKFDTDITVPVVWTNMSQSELNEKFTASVAVGNIKDGYQTVWSGRYGRLDVFDLPTQEEIFELIGYNRYETEAGNLKYESVGGYQEDSTGLSLTSDKTFYFDLTPKQYTLTVEGVQKADGSTETRTYHTQFGESFDLKNLKSTGANDPETLTYSIFQGLTDENDQSVTSLTVDMLFVENYGDSAVLKANYLDNTLKATYQFVGLGNDVEPVTVKFQKGTTPYFEGLSDYIKEHGGNENIGYEISPVPAPSESSITYTVLCKAVNSPKYTLSFETNGGNTISPNEYVEGNTIYPPTDPVRTGYTFGGWFKDESLSQAFDFTGATMPNQDMTLYAKWNANTYTVSFDVANGDITQNPEAREIVYGAAYGELPVLSHSTLKFLGWFTQKDGGTQVTADTIFQLTEDQTLYAHWEQKKQVNEDWIKYSSLTVDYDKNTHPFIFTVEAPDGNLKAEDFTVTYKPEGQGAEWTEEVPVNAGTYSVKLTLDSNHSNYAAGEILLETVIRINKIPAQVTARVTASMANWHYQLSGSIQTESDGKMTLDLYYYELVGEFQTPKFTFIGSYDKRDFDIPQQWRKIPDGKDMAYYAVKVKISEGTNHNSWDSKYYIVGVYSDGNDIAHHSASYSADAANLSDSVTQTAAETKAVTDSKLERISRPTALMARAAAPMTLPVDANSIATMTLSPEDVVLNRGKEFEVTLEVGEDVPVWGILAAVDYDTESLELTGYTIGDIFEESQFTMQEDLSKAPYRFLATLDTLETTSAQGAFITLKFRVKASAAEKETAITLQNLEAVNETSQVPMEKGSAARIAVDDTAPVLEGVKNGETYYGKTTVTVLEEHLQSVTVNHKEVSVSDGKFTLLPAQGTQTIVATDRAGNSTTVTITVKELDSSMETGDYRNNIISLGLLLLSGAFLLLFAIVYVYKRKEARE